MNWKDIFPVLDQKFSAERCLERVYAIYSTDRWFSFDQYPKTAAYCAKSMQDAGLSEIELLPLKADGKTVYGDWKFPKAWKVDHAKLWYENGVMIADYSRKPCSLVMYSPSTTSGPVTAQVIDIEDAKEPPADNAWTGKIILTDRRAADVLSIAEKAGAIGILSDTMPLIPGIRDFREELIDDCPWQGLGDAGEKSSVFAFHLTPRQGKAMREKLLSAPVYVKADVKTEFYDGVCHTVSGLLQGTDPSLPEVFAYGHLYEPGANDNASGSAALLELADCLQEAIQEGLLPQPKRSIRFAVGGECNGSMGYMAAHPDRKMLCGGVFDMVGTESIDRAELSLRYDPIANWSFADAAIDVSNRLCSDYFGIEHQIKEVYFCNDIGTDNIIADPCFNVPAIAMVAAPALSYHSSMDTPDRIEPQILKRNAMILGTYLYGLANADEDTCRFLAEEIHAKTKRILSVDSHTRKVKHMGEASARALYSLNKISEVFSYPMPCETKLPMPTYAQNLGANVPHRMVKGCLTLDAHPEVLNPKYNPAWNPDYNIPLFWADGVRTLWEIAVQTALESGKCSDEEIKEMYTRITDYFVFLEQLGYITWKN